MKKYIENIKQRYQLYQKQQQEEYFDREREYFSKKQLEKYKKVMYKEESESEPEIEPVRTWRRRRRYWRRKKEVKQSPQKRENNMFDYLSKDAKGNKQ